MGILKFKEMLNNISQQIGITNTPTEEEVNQYYEMVYGLFLSRGTEGYLWGIDKENIMNYIEFHLGRSCNQQVVSDLMKCLVYAGYGQGYSLPTEPSTLFKFSRFKDSTNYKYPKDIAFDIAKTNVKKLEMIAKSLTDDVIVKYYNITYALLSTIKGGVTFAGIAKYVAFQLGGMYNAQTLNQVVEMFEQSGTCNGYSENDGKIYSLGNHIAAQTLYLNRHVFGIASQDFVPAKPYKCSIEEAYRICYPGVMEKINTDYQKIIDVVSTRSITYFKDGVNRGRTTYRDLIGNASYEEYIRYLTKKLYLEGNTVVERVLYQCLDAALWSQQKMDSVASVALRALHFKKYNGAVDAYTSVSEEECRNFVLNNDEYTSVIQQHPFDEEETILGCIGGINGAGIFNTDTGLLAEPFCWMPDRKRDAYYADAICYSYVKAITETMETGDPDAPNDICDMIWECINLSDEERQKREEEEREREQNYKEYKAKMEEERRQKEEENRRKTEEEAQKRAALSKELHEKELRRKEELKQAALQREKEEKLRSAAQAQCRACAHAGHCNFSINNNTPNCAGFTPRR